MEKFRKLGLSEEVLKTLASMKIDTPSEIQAKTIPLVLDGNDVIGASKTGSGKTLAFSSAIIEKIVPEKKVKALILTPTRELAEQVASAIRQFSKDNLKVTAVYGGVNIDMQIRKMRGTDVLVGTPGRILDHLNRKTLQLNKVEILVLDEFDRMLDMGFIHDVDKIIGECPKKRQTMLFSATISADVDYISKKYMNNPKEISVESFVDHSKLKQIYYDVPDGLKFSLLVHLLKEEESHLVMVFCSTRRNADFVVTNLNNLGIDAKAIHGGMDQKKRIRVLEEFNGKGGIKIIVCTDVAARGLDIKGVSHVYNYDLPRDPIDYIHRIGRTARAGENGKAVSILASRDYEFFSDIINHEKTKIEEIELPYVKKVDIVRDNGKRNMNNFRLRNSGRRDLKERNQSKFPRRSNSKGNDRQLFDAVCKKCGKKCKVPFKPTTGKGVLCSDCFVPKNSNGRERNNSRGRNSRPNNSNSRGRFQPRDSGRNDSRGRFQSKNFSRGRNDSRKNNSQRRK
jgi:ATP-dependent RNA helicase DeaD